jgi:hypothetical protein
MPVIYRLDDDLGVAVDQLSRAIDQRIERRIAELMPDVIPTGEWLTVREVAAKYNLSTSEVRTMAREGGLPGAVKAGHGHGRWRFRAADLPDAPPAAPAHSSTPLPD